ncbi:hypothetical protein AGMMS49936_09930 [Endomicrobiia bacterium]|nr:hypothetical protein AGMMS49936_09930 [Endomicrobiia bacterium]
MTEDIVRRRVSEIHKENPSKTLLEIGRVFWTIVKSFEVAPSCSLMGEYTLFIHLLILYGATSNDLTIVEDIRPLA